MKKIDLLVKEYFSAKERMILAEDKMLYVMKSNKDGCQGTIRVMDDGDIQIKFGGDVLTKDNREATVWGQMKISPDMAICIAECLTDLLTPLNSEE